MLSLSLSVCLSLSLLLSLSLPIVNHYKSLGIIFYTGLTILYAFKYMSDSARNSVQGILTRFFFFFFKCCCTSTKTIRLNWDGEPSTATSTFTQILLGFPPPPLTFRLYITVMVDWPFKINYHLSSLSSCVCASRIMRFESLRAAV